MLLSVVGCSWLQKLSPPQHLASELLQHPTAKHGEMDEAQTLPPDSPPDRFWLIYENICRFCDRMWANIASMRSRAMEHIIFAATILGLYLGFSSAFDYKIGWWSFTGILSLLAFTLPHLLLTLKVIGIKEYRLGPEHIANPQEEPEKKLLDALDRMAYTLDEESGKISSRYFAARNFFWRIGFPIWVTLCVLDWLL